MDFERYNVRQECVEKQDDVISICGLEFKISWDELLDSLRSIEVKDERNECVKMHDVIRDVAISIASREEHSHMVRCDEAMEDWPEKDRQRNYTAISLRCIGMHSLPHNLELPNLQLLRLEYHHELPETPDCFYQGMQELKVVALAYMDVQSLPTSLQCLTNLLTLSIYHCKLSGDISVIGALKNLEILSFTGSTMENFSRGLSSLSRLEELYVGDSVHSWNVPSSSKLVLEEGEEEELEITTDDADAASIAELASLSNLVVLDIYLPDLKFWPRDLVLGKVKIFYITVGCRSQNWDCYLFQQNQLTLDLLDISELLESGLKMLLKSTKILELTGGGGLNLKNGLCDLVDGEGFECLTELSLNDCGDLEFLINSTDHRDLELLEVKECRSVKVAFDLGELIVREGHPAVALFSLTNVKLIHLPKLSHVLMNNSARIQGFNHLRSLRVKGCGKLRNLFSSSLAKLFVKLQELEITECVVMEAVIAMEQRVDDEVTPSTIIFLN
ncbi:Disease resistance protein [Camellia lanceoleosa]|uniref:Disease resistance protein n=1 Tax=Camellia lanceoleosa TaxID=1840588 RepID=A0ACC0FWZ6_9ERIC|nr:Disease resistance protein [Camellia lanceoleosa]